MALIERRLRIQPGSRPGLYRFAINEDDITPLVKKAKIEIFYQPERKTKVTINIAVDAPEDIEVTLFTGNKPNGFNRSC